MSNLLTRTISAIFALTLLGLSVKFGSNSLYLLCFLSSLLALTEFSTFLKKAASLSDFEFRIIRICFVTLGGVLFVFASRYSAHLIITFPLAFVVLAAGVSWFVARKENLSELLPMLNMFFLGFIYCAILPSVSVRLIELGVGVFLCHLAVVFGGDVFAYFVGRFVGRHKLHEALSPKKTLEGSIGGLVGSLLLGFGLGPQLGFEISMLQGFILFALTGLFAQLGDLFESFLKRYAQVKDSGSIMPGHGGVLDRLDGVLFSSPVFLLIYFLFSRS
jgi:phosphatidate cytidylyltransferase